MANSNQIVAAVLASVRGEMSTAYVADLCGVRESQVREWKDIFVVAGVLAVANVLNPHVSLPTAENGEGGEPTTNPPPFGRTR